MNQKLWTKLLASLLVVTLTFANFIMLGVYASNTYGAEDNLEKQETITSNRNVVFDAYFKDEKGNITHTLREDINKQDLKLYAKLEVKRGYLKNATIQILGENGTNSNLKLNNSSDTSENVEAIDNNTNTINLKQINAGTQIVLEIPVVAGKDDIYDLSNFSKLDDIVLKGNYIGDSGKETKIEKSIKTRCEWKAEVTPILDGQVIRFIPYAVGEKNGTILQTVIKSGISENVLPLEETKIEITVPQINGKNPESVNVIPNGVLATNGMTQEEFGENNWTYNSETGIVVILVRNEADQNKVSWLKNIQDEFVVTYNYSEKVDTVEATQKAISEIKVYNSVETKVSRENELSITQNEVLGQIVTANVTATEALSKGYLYTKANRETLYRENVTIDVAYPKLVDSLNIEQGIDYFVNDKGETSPTTVRNTNYAYYKTTKISKANFEKILGGEGTLKITSLDGKELVTINKNTQTDENGNYVYNYEEETNQIKIQTSAPVETGKLEIVHEKVLKGKTDYSKKQVESFKTLKLAASVQAYAGDNIIAENESAKEITLIAPTTKIEAESNNENLSTVVANEDVELRTILKTSDITCDLYKNPTVEIVLPNYIKQVNVKDINLLFDDELTIKEYKTYVNQSGNIVINVTLQGEQTKYSGDEISKGANLIINADITLKNLTPTRNDVMKVYVTNELSTAYENEVNKKAYAETALNAVAPIGIVTTNTVSSYNNAKETVTSISGTESVGKLDFKSNAQTATISMNIINNNRSAIENVSILGRIPFTGNKDVLTGKDLGTNINTQIAGGITSRGLDASKVKIYYSENPEATKDLQNVQNGWVEILEASKVKSYLIVFTGYAMNVGEVIEFEYNINIPENLNYNQTLATNYVVYYTEQKAEAYYSRSTSEQTAVATPVTLTTGEGIELETNLTSNVEAGSEVSEGKIIKYTVNVKNVGSKDAKDIRVKVPIPNGAVYTRYMTQEEYEDEIGEEYIEEGYIDFYDVSEYTKTIANIRANETVTVEFELKVDTRENLEEETILQIHAIIEAELLPESITTNTITNKVVEGFFDVVMKTYPSEENGIVKENQKITYTTDIKNLSIDKRTNVVATAKVPEGTTYVSAYIMRHGEKIAEGVTYNNDTRTVIWQLSELEGEEEINAVLEVMTNEVTDGSMKKTFINKATVTCNETKNEFTTNEVSNVIKLTSLEVTYSNSIGDVQITDKDEVEYYITIKNIGANIAKSIKITDYLPKTYRYIGATILIDGKETSLKNGGSTATVELDLEEGQTAKVTLKMAIKAITDAKSKEVENKIEVNCASIGYFSENITKHIIKATDNTIVKPDEQEQKYNISGMAWLDENKDGKRDEKEKAFSGIELILINAEDGKVLKDSSGNNIKIKTDEQGNYIFRDIAKGNYMVVFLYDSKEYDVTEYKKAGLNEAENSNAITMKINMDGQEILGAVSDKLVVTNKNIYNINIGLYVNQKFDLKLDKTITKISETSSQGTKEHTYKDVQLAKLDLNSKTIEGTTIVVEYRIKVTNEGAIAGYAKKIVDYLPKDMKFSAEINLDWYVGEDGNLYSTSLADVILQPGESQELTLLLTKTMNSENTGIINNKAEICESYNDLGKPDCDSIAGNNAQDEDDQSYADAIIGIKTGEVYLLIVITLITLAVFGLGIYFINKKVLRGIE